VYAENGAHGNVGMLMSINKPIWYRFIKQLILSVKLQRNGDEVTQIMSGVRIFPFHTCIRQWEAELCSRTNREAYS